MRVGIGWDSHRLRLTALLSLHSRFLSCPCHRAILAPDLVLVPKRLANDCTTLRSSAAFVGDLRGPSFPRTVYRAATGCTWTSRGYRRTPRYSATSTQPVFVPSMPRPPVITPVLPLPYRRVPCVKRPRGDPASFFGSRRAAANERSQSLLPQWWAARPRASQFHAGSCVIADLPTVSASQPGDSRRASRRSCPPSRSLSPPPLTLLRHFHRGPCAAPPPPLLPPPPPLALPPRSPSPRSSLFSPLTPSYSPSYFSPPHYHFSPSHPPPRFLHPTSPPPLLASLSTTLPIYSPSPFPSTTITPLPPSLPPPPPPSHPHPSPTTPPPSPTHPLTPPLPSSPSSPPPSLSTPPPSPTPSPSLFFPVPVSLSSFSPPTCCLTPPS